MRSEALALILSCVGALMILAGTSTYGAGVSPDSIEYLATARSIAAGDGALSYDDAPMILWPPLYPAVLAGIYCLSGVDPLSSAPIVNAVLFGVTIYLSYLLFLRHSESSRAFPLVGAASVLVSFPLVHVSLWAWSEALFIVLVLVYLITSELYLARGTASLLLLVSSSVALACLTRYIGVILIPTGLVTILAFRCDALGSKVRHLLLFACVSTAPVGMWVVRNYYLSGALLGPREPSEFSAFQNVVFAVHGVVSWFVPGLKLVYEFFDPHRIVYTTGSMLSRDMVREHGTTLLVIGTGVGLLAGLVFRNRVSSAAVACGKVGPLVLYVFAYVAFLVVSSTTTRYDPIGDRLLSPVFVPVCLMLLLVARRVLTSLLDQPPARQRAGALLACLIAAWLLYPTAKTMWSVAISMRDGLGFNSVRWRTSETIQYVRQDGALEPGCAVYSNQPWGLYYLTQRGAKPSPRRPVPPPSQGGDAADLQGIWPEEDCAYLVWFTGKWLPNLTVEELEGIADMQEIARFEDGVVYRVERAGGAAGPSVPDASLE